MARIHHNNYNKHKSNTGVVITTRTCRYTVIRHEVIEEVPQLMGILSRVGNADHGTAREASMVQLWRRLFSVRIANPDIDDHELVARAKKGNSEELAKSVAYLPKFVATFSGGADGHILKDIERFEKTCRVKRKLSAPVLKQFGELTISDYKTWVPMCIKAMLSAPRQFSQSGLILPSDIVTMQKPKVFAEIRQAQTFIQQAKDYLDAHIVPDKMSKRLAMCRIDTLDI